jgi:indolepyruvate ferredoxin oxidoreductase
MTSENSSLKEVTLEDKYKVLQGTLYLTGIQALVKLPLVQREIDRKAGLHTAGFISGYRGSPLGSYDQQLWKAKKFLDEAGVRFVPGVNEELAATAIWGTQQLAFEPGSELDGVTKWRGTCLCQRAAQGFEH